MSANNLSQFCGETRTVTEVVAALSAIRDAAASDIHAPRIDGISCFSRLYATITHTVQDALDGAHPHSVFTDAEFTTRLTLDFARRYLDAILAYERRDTSTPRCWQVLFDHRRTPTIGHVNFAAAGANAHINYDLALALLITWQNFPPTPERRRDYDLVNDLIATQLDNLREDFDAFLADTGEDSLLDRFGNAMSDLLVRTTRGHAWNTAEQLWHHRDNNDTYTQTLAVETARLDNATTALSAMILTAPTLP